MTKKQFEALGRKLLSALPGYEARDDLIFRCPIAHTLEGFCFETRDEAESFYVWAFFMPLRVPKAYITLNFGERLGGGGHSWDRRTPDLSGLLAAVRDQAIPFLSGLDSPAEVIAKIRTLRVPQNDYYVYQDIGYLLLGTAVCRRQLRTSIGPLLRCGRNRSLLGPSLLWDRAILLVDELVEGPANARRLLDSWEAETLGNLKLERFRDPAHNRQQVTQRYA